MLREEACYMLMEELDHFKASGLSFSQPNSMNRHGMLLEELGMENFIKKLTDTIEPVARQLYPDLVGSTGLDSCRAFTVDYNAVEEPGAVEPDRELATHFDNAEVTLNISLTTGHEEGELYFIRDSSKNTAWPVQHRQGY